MTENAEITNKKNAFARNTSRQKTEQELEKDVFDLVKKIINEKQKKNIEKSKKYK